MINTKDLEYQVFTLGDIGVIELLISYRYKYDDYFYLSMEAKMATTSNPRLNEEVLLTYASLDSYIDKCKFNTEQLKILEMMSHGFSYREIAFELGLNPSTIPGRLTTIYKRIARENEREWRKVTYTNKLNLKTKNCSRCKEDLPATVEFYREHPKTKDGFQTRCKECEKYDYNRKR